MHSLQKSTTATTLRLSLAFAFVLILIAGVGWYGLQGLSKDLESETRSQLLLKKYHLASSMQNELLSQSLTVLSNAHSIHFSNFSNEPDLHQQSGQLTAASNQLLAMEPDSFEHNTLKQQQEMLERHSSLQNKARELAAAGQNTRADQLYHTELIPLQELQLANIRALLEHYNSALTSEHQQGAEIHASLIHTTKAAGISALVLGIVIATFAIIYIHKIHCQLLRNKEELDNILDGMMTGVIVIDQRGVIENFNHAAAEIFGYPQDQITGKHMSQLLGRHSQERHQDYIQQYFQHGEAFIHLGERVVTAVRANGTTFPLRIMLSRLPADKHGMQRVIASCFDITEQKEQENRLRTSQKMDALGKLSGGIAHDFNNLLTVIMGYTDVLAESIPTDNSLQKYIAEIKQATESGKKLTAKLLNFARVKPLESQYVDLNQLLHDTQLMLEHSLSSDTQLQMQVSTSACMVNINVDDLQHALLNLSINAKHAMPEGGTLTITTRQASLDEHDAQIKKVKPGEYIILTVEDTGCGMDERTRNHIFEPFFSTKGDNGTGLGLSQVYGFVKRSKGFIEVVSNPGMGTSFELYFPRAGTPAMQPAPAA